MSTAALRYDGTIAWLSAGLNVSGPIYAEMALCHGSILPAGASAPTLTQQDQRVGFTFDGNVAALTKGLNVSGPIYADACFFGRPLTAYPTDTSPTSTSAASANLVWDGTTVSLTAGLNITGPLYATECYCGGVEYPIVGTPTPSPTLSPTPSPTPPPSPSPTMCTITLTTAAPSFNAYSGGYNGYLYYQLWADDTQVVPFTSKTLSDATTDTYFPGWQDGATKWGDLTSADITVEGASSTVTDYVMFGSSLTDAALTGISLVYFASTSWATSAIELTCGDSSYSADITSDSACTELSCTGFEAQATSTADGLWLDYYYNGGSAGGWYRKLTLAIV